MTLLDEWIGKAEGDYKTAVALNRPRKEPLPDAVCYHCQQSAEKYLKAYLLSQSVAPPYTHNLLNLLAECVTHDASLAACTSWVGILNPYSVQFRYPGDSATVAESKVAVITLRKMRRRLRKKLGL